MALPDCWDGERCRALRGSQWTSPDCFGEPSSQEGRECGRCLSNVSGGWRHSSVLQSTQPSLLWVWRYVGLTWHEKARSRRRRHISHYLMPRNNWQSAGYVNWHNVVCICTTNSIRVTRPKSMMTATYIHLLQRIILASNTIVDTMTSRAQQILDGSPFTWPIAFEYDVKTSHMEITEGRVIKRPATCLFELRRRHVGWGA